MDLGLKELGITFLVGAFSIVGLDFLYYHFFSVHITPFFKGWFEHENVDSPLATNTEDTSDTIGPKVAEVKGEPKDLTLKTAIFIGLAFGIGMLAEDFSHRFADSIQRPLAFLPSFVRPNELTNKFYLGGKDDLRVATLIDINEENGKWEPDWLAVDLARTGTFKLANQKTGEKVDKWAADWTEQANKCEPSVNSSADCPSNTDVKDSIRQLYYFAKNKAYEHNNYYDEMKRIQTRLEFSRSISMIALLYLVGSAFALLLVMVSRRRRRDSTKSNIWGKLTKDLLVLLVVFLIYFFSTWGYARESYDFNKRAFGYLSSIRLSKDEALKVEKAKQKFELEMKTLELNKKHSEQQNSGVSLP